MNGMSSRYVTVLDRELHYVEWGASNADVVVMWHGLARTGRDFDEPSISVVDGASSVRSGGGLSEWSPHPEVATPRTDDGRVAPHYDPKIAMQFELHANDYDQWDCYDRIAASTLVLRGDASDLLLPDVAAEMTRSGPRAHLEVIAGCGHAPALKVPQQMAWWQLF